MGKNEIADFDDFKFKVKFAFLGYWDMGQNNLRRFGGYTDMGKIKLGHFGILDILAFWTLWDFERFG